MRRLLLLFTAVSALALSACHHHHDDDDPPPDVPAGGAAFGVFLQFEHDFAERTISSTFDSDGFSFTLAEESTVMITVTALSSVDPFVDLYDSNMNFIVGDDNGGPGVDSIVVGQFAAGDYVAVVGGIGGSTGSYAIDILVGSLGGLDFEILTPPVSVGDSFGFIDNSLDADSYYFTLLTPAIVDISILRLNGDYDGNLQLVDQFGNEIAYIDPVLDGDPSIIGVNLTEGSYLVVVGATSGSGGYDIQIDAN